MLSLIKITFNSLFFIYKNIFHWILSKILIVLSTFIMWILVALPFVLLAILIIYLSPLTLSNFLIWVENILSEFLLNKWWALIVGILFIFSVLFFLITINYKRVLLAKLNFSYIKWEKLNFLQNEYFNIKLISKNIKISLFILLWILLITILFGIFWIILVLFFWWLDNINNIMAINWINAFSIISLILTIFYSLVILYFLYRTYFSLYIILEDDKKTAFKAIKKSIKKTRKIKKMFKFILIFLLFSVLLLPINYVGQYIDFDSKKLEYYINIKNKTILKQELTDKENVDYTFLDNEFWKYNNKELIEKYNKNSIINTIYFVLHFLLIFGIFDLVLANFYKREIK